MEPGRVRWENEWEARFGFVASKLLFSLKTRDIHHLSRDEAGDYDLQFDPLPTFDDPDVTGLP